MIHVDTLLKHSYSLILANFYYYDAPLPHITYICTITFC